MKKSDTIRKNKRFTRRKFHVRNAVRGSAERPRLAVFRSNLHIEAQVIDDVAGRTLASASSKQGGVLDDSAKGGAVSGASLVGKKLAEAAKAAGVEKVVFDRGGRKYHGRVKALAEAAREGGLSF